jgi:uncharacterized protein (TIGR02996 family)
MSPDETAFLGAIGNDPANETARLVYADWLADRDDPRAAFARLSAEFLRCVRGMADSRREFPAEWLDVVDPLFNRLRFVRSPHVTNGGWLVARSFVTPGDSVARDQKLFDLEEDKAMVEVPSAEAGTIIAVFVRSGQRVVGGEPLIAYLALPVRDAPAASAEPARPPSEPTE